MTAPRRIPDAPIRDLPALLSFVNQLWIPNYRLLLLKLAGILSEPGEFAVPLWDGQTWHSAQVGSVGSLPDTDSLIDPALGTVYVAREGTLTADHTYMPVAGGNYDSITVWNLTSQYTLTLTLGAGDMTLPPSYVGRIHGNPAAFVGVYREPVTMNPTSFG